MFHLIIFIQKKIYIFCNIFQYLGKGVDDFKVNLETQKVEVKSSLSADEILEVIKKTGKETQLISTA